MSESNLTIIGRCSTQAAKYEGEAELWRAMEKAMGLAYQKLTPDERTSVAVLLARAVHDAGDERG